MNFTQKKTKIVATIGPSSDNYETLKQMVKDGVSVVRVNFSHGDRSEQIKKFQLANEISEELGIPVPIILDTKGPEVRVGKIKDDLTKIEARSVFKVRTDKLSYHDLIGDSSLFAVSHEIETNLKIGDKILFDDGKLVSVVKDIKPGEVTLKALNNHNLKSSKRLNLPGVDLNLPFLSSSDVADIVSGIKAGVNMIAASFVNNAKDIEDLRDLLKREGGENIKIIAKIETMTAIKEIDQIIKAADGIMIARGDLGLEIPFEDVPYHQERIISTCRKINKPVIVATQMLDSMEGSPQPTRAEVSDVYFATKLGADATMLSGETAQGNFAVESVRTMALINRRAEQTFANSSSYDNNIVNIWKSSNKDELDRTAYQLALRCSDWDYRYLIVIDESIKTLEKISHYRPKTLIIGVLKDKNVNGFGVRSGVFVSKDSGNFFKDPKVDKSRLEAILKPFLAEKGDRYLVFNEGKIEEFIHS